MTKAEIREHLKHIDFEPFVIHSSAGGKYPVMHPDFAIITDRGTIHIFEPNKNNKGDARFLGAVSLLHITALEPLNASKAGTGKGN